MKWIVVNQSFFNKESMEVSVWDTEEEAQTARKIYWLRYLATFYEDRKLVPNERSVDIVINEAHKMNPENEWGTAYLMPTLFIQRAVEFCGLGSPVVTILRVEEGRL